ncbi:MAG: hypothetical protein FWD95_00585 [Nocardioidaceae bacterium]|nr:hypothetical protein [Nocardioidaceae bacterium]
MAGVRRIIDEVSASSLANMLNGDARRRPVVVITVPTGRTEPWIDVEEVAREAGNLAEVYLMPTGPFTWEFSNRMAEGTQVYGGAGRVYPVGHEWASDLSKSPLRFAFNAADGERATQHLISDLFRMAAAAGLLQELPAHALRELSGVVKMTVAGRALVDIGGSFPAAIAEELTVEDVPIERIARPGQRIRGWYDADTNRLDVTKFLRAGPEALAGYNVGDVVLTRVTRVRTGRAELMLYPKTSTPAVTVTVLRADVTTNPADDLTTLMTTGEVIPARVAAPGPSWSLVLNDVDDDEHVADAPSLLEGGPAWLVAEAETIEAAPPQPLAMPTPTPPRPREAPSQYPAATPAAIAPPRPSPALLDNRRSSAGSAPADAARATQPPDSTRALLLKIDGLTAEVAGLKREAHGLREQLLAGVDERDQLRYLLDQAERNFNRAENELKATRARLRKASTARPATTAGDGPQFADAEQGFRYLVLTQWATRTLPVEQPERPLDEYILGPRFLDSLGRLEGIKTAKVADVVFEIVTGLAPQLPSREVHHLRTGPGGDDPVRVREDGAVAWRASLQVNTPSARRIHYWVLPGSPIEFARVATHDDLDV